MRIGIDLGGTKIEGIVMGAGSAIRHRRRVATPRDSYEDTVAAVVQLVRDLERDAGAQRLPVGLGTPGSLSPVSGLMRNANSVCLNGQPLKQAIEAELGRPVRMANDANCLAVSEAADGAAAGADVVFAAILGTGCGGGLSIAGRPRDGLNGVGGEWGHNPLPWPRADWGELPGPRCWHGLQGCQEIWLSGTGLAGEHLRRTGQALSGEEIVAQADRPECAETLNRYYDRLARALASVINLLDPDVIVLGGGASRIEAIYAEVPRRWGQWVFSDQVSTPLRPALHGDSSGVRGAAWLWPEISAEPTQK